MLFMFNQIPFMKISKILSLLVLVVVAMSCSKDDEPEPRIEDAALSFENGTVLQVPQGLLESDDPMAMEAAGWVSMANTLSANLITPPPGATRTTELITPVNGRTSALSGVVYIWEDSQVGKVAYQITDADSKYVFELFYKGMDDTGWYRYFYAEELKDRSKGYMAIYDAWGFMDESRGAEMMRWDWSRKGDMFTMEMANSEGDFNFIVEINTKTKAGSVVYFYDGIKQSEVIWNAQGNGSWTSFDETGAVVEQGSW